MAAAERSSHPALDLALARSRTSLRARVARLRSKSWQIGQCAIAAPDVFRMNDEGKLEYEEIADEARRLEVEEAADVCPVQAILIEG